jgi:hypothetical protein
MYVLNKTVTNIPQPRKGPNGILVFMSIFFMRSGIITKAIPLKEAIIIETILPTGPRKKAEALNNLTSPKPIPLFESFLISSNIKKADIEVMRFVINESVIMEYIIPDIRMITMLVSGIIMNSRSTKVKSMIEKASAEKVKASKVEFARRKLKTKHEPVKSSTNGYLIGIFHPQFRHFPLRSI